MRSYPLLLCSLELSKELECFVRVLSSPLTRNLEGPEFTRPERDRMREQVTPSAGRKAGEEEQ